MTDRPVSAADGDSPVMRLWRQAVAESKRECQDRRARVLAHPDLAQRLKDPPLALSNPAHWTGYIPPRTLPQDDRPWARANNSPARRQLVDIVAEALARESAS